MNRFGPRTVFLALALALAACAGRCGSAPCHTGPIAQKLGVSKLLIGADLDDESAFHAPLSVRAHYVTGPAPDAPCDTCGACTLEGQPCVGNEACHWWGCWQDPSFAPGKFVADQAAKARARGAIPFFTYYAWLATSGGVEGGAELAALADQPRVQRYLDDLDLFARRLGELPAGPLLVHLEPDLWGFGEQLSPDATAPVALSNTHSQCASLPQTLAGFAQCLVRIVRARAPNALVSLHASSWGALGADAFREGSEGFDVRAHALATAAYLRALGADQADFLVIEMNHRDAGANQQWWDESDRTRPNFAQAISWASTVSDALRLPYLWWQVPLGHHGLANRCTAYADNRLDYVFDHPERFAAAGALGVVFGAGDPCMTRPSTDGGHFLKRANDYPAHAPELCGQ